MVKLNFFFWGGGGEGGVNKVYCGLCENGEFKRDKLQIDIPDAVFL